MELHEKTEEKLREANDESIHVRCSAVLFAEILFAFMNYRCRPVFMMRTIGSRTSLNLCRKIWRDHGEYLEDQCNSSSIFNCSYLVHVSSFYRRCQSSLEKDYLMKEKQVVEEQKKATQTAEKARALIKVTAVACAAHVTSVDLSLS